MKPKLAVVLSLLLAAGCSTVNWGVIGLIGARRGTYEVVKKHPEYRPAFVAAVTVLDQQLLQDQPDYGKVVAALQGLKINEIQGEEGAMLVQDAIDMLNALLGEGWRPKDETKAKLFLEALRDGIHRGLAMATP